MIPRCQRSQRSHVTLPLSGSFVNRLADFLGRLNKKVSLFHILLKVQRGSLCKVMILSARRANELCQKLRTRKGLAIDAEILYNTALWGERPHGLFVTLTLRGSDGKEYTT